jgi:hypothetical protein
MRRIFAASSHGKRGLRHNYRTPTKGETMSTNSDTELAVQMAAAESRAALASYGAQLFGQRSKPAGRQYLDIATETSDAMADFGKQLFATIGRSHTRLNLTPNTNTDNT